MRNFLAFDHQYKVRRKAVGRPAAGSGDALLAQFFGSDSDAGNGGVEGAVERGEGAIEGHLNSYESFESAVLVELASRSMYQSEQRSL